MNEIKDNFTVISGGNPLAAVNTFVVVFGLPSTIISVAQTYEEIGHRIGEAVFNKVYPDPLGQMEYPDKETG